MAEKIKGFNRLTLKSTINDSSDYHSDKNDAESNLKSDQLVYTQNSDRKESKVTDTDTIKGNSPHKLLINRLIPQIIPVVIPQVNQTTADGVAASGGTLYVVRTVLLKEIVTDAVRSAASFCGKLGGHGRDDSMGKKHCQNPPQSNYPSLNWYRTLGIPN